MRRLLIATAVLAGSFYFSAAQDTSAATFKGPTGITVSPAFSQVKINPTETERPLQFKVTNNENVPQTLQISTADFNALNESGGLLFVGTNPTALQKKYGLAKWLRLSDTSVTIQPKETRTINAVIVNEPDLAPGGHYGALMLSLPNTQTAAAKNKVAINSIASSLLFVTKTGGETYRLKLIDVESNQNLFSLPSSVTLRFKNDGNSHLIPRGVVSITDPSGKLVKKGVINEDSSIILPGTFRRYTVPLKNISTSLVPGNYKLTVDFRFDGYETFRTYQTSRFLLTPSALLLLIPVALIVVAIFGYYSFKNGTYKHLLNKPKKRRKKRK